MSTNEENIALAIGTVVGLLLMIPIYIWVVQLLWNNVLVEVGPFNPITYWQSLGVIVIGKLITGGSNVNSNN
jgi:hypothetical protein